MRHLILSIIFSFLFQSSFTQGNARANTPSFTNQANQSGLNGANRAMRNIARMSAQYRYQTIAEEYDEIDGTPYFNEEAVLATLVINNDSLQENVPLKYDQYMNEVIVTDENGETLLLDTKFYKEFFFDLDDQKISFKKVNPKKPDVFHQILYESDDMVLFKKQEAKLRKGENLGITKFKSTFKKQVKYYIIESNKPIKRINLKKKNFFDDFPPRDAIHFLKYIETHNVKLSKEKDYLKLFDGVKRERQKREIVNRP